MTILLAIMAAAALSTARPAPLDADIFWVAHGEFCEPETVLPLPEDTLLVSNVCDFRKNGGRLYVGGKRLWCVDLVSGAVKTIGPEWLADIDGIELESDGTLQITPVGAPLIRYRSDDDVSIHGGDGVSSASHGYAARLGLALIPTGFDNTVIALRIAQPAAP